MWLRKKDGSHFLILTRLESVVSVWLEKIFKEESGMNNYFDIAKSEPLACKAAYRKKSGSRSGKLSAICGASVGIYCGVELICSDLIDIAVQANKDGNELFSVISDAETFVQEVKPSLKRLSWFDFFTVAIPIYLFLGWGIEGVFLYPLVLSAIPDYKIEISFGLPSSILYLYSICLLSLPAYDGTCWISAVQASNKMQWVIFWSM